jgi:hypothetical protein
VDKLYFRVIESTNKKQVLEFIKTLCDRMAKPHKSIIVIDNHRSHTSFIVQDYLNSKGVKCLWTAPGGSAINAIERCWGLLKGRWRRIMIEMGLSGADHDHNVFKAKLRTALAGISKRQIANLRNGVTTELCRTWYNSLQVDYGEADFVDPVAEYNAFKKRKEFQGAFSRAMSRN